MIQPSVNPAVNPAVSASVRKRNLRTGLALAGELIAQRVIEHIAGAV